jgi:phosphatidylglycerophosphate synthase
LSLRERRVIAQPPEYSPSPTDGVYRFFSIFLSVPLARLGATPNAITVGWAVVGMLGVACLLAETWTVRVLGALLLELSYLLDFVDGEVARLSDRRSRRGGFLDLLGHGVIKTSLPLGAGAAATALTGASSFLLAGAVGAIAVGVGDALRFYAAATSGDLAAGDLSHDVAPRPPRERRITAGRVVVTLFELSFESPGLFGLTLLVALADAWAAFALYLAVGGTVWFLLRAVRYARRLG